MSAAVPAGATALFTHGARSAKLFVTAASDLRALLASAVGAEPWRALRLAHAGSGALLECTAAAVLAHASVLGTGLLEYAVCDAHPTAVATFGALHPPSVVVDAWFKKEQHVPDDGRVALQARLATAVTAVDDAEIGLTVAAHIVVNNRLDAFAIESVRVMFMLPDRVLCARPGSADGDPTDARAAPLYEAETLVERTVGFDSDATPGPLDADAAAARATRAAALSAHTAYEEPTRVATLATRFRDAGIKTQSRFRCLEWTVAQERLRIKRPLCKAVTVISYTPARPLLRSFLEPASLFGFAKTFQASVRVKRAELASELNNTLGLSCVCIVTLRHLASKEDARIATIGEFELAVRVDPAAHPPTVALEQFEASERDAKAARSHLKEYLGLNAL